MNRILLILSSFVILSCSNSINEKDAIRIALKNGISWSCEEPTAEFIGINHWLVKSHLCTQGYQEYYEEYLINSITGEIDSIMYSGAISLHPGGLPIESRVSSLSLDSLNDISSGKPHKLLNIENEDVGKFDINNSNIVAFEYSDNSIGIINVDGTSFLHICDSCSNPMWFDISTLYFIRKNNIIGKNINTLQEKVVMANVTFSDYRISPNSNWIAFIDDEIWNKPQVDSLGRKNITLFTNGADLELCLFSLNTKKIKYLTKIGRRVHTIAWSPGSDSIFFYVENEAYYATGLIEKFPKVSPSSRFKNTSIPDYNNTVKGFYPYKIRCRIFGIELYNNRPGFILVDEVGYYENISFTQDMKHLVYTKKDCESGKNSLWIVPIDTKSW